LQWARNCGANLGVDNLQYTVSLHQRRTRDRPPASGAATLLSRDSSIVHLAFVDSGSESKPTHTEPRFRDNLVERDKCGFDLECTKNGAIEQVEVKGIRGTGLCFIITAGEVQQARANANFILAVVTSALSGSPKLTNTNE
jgi:hypothetical protein